MILHICTSFPQAEPGLLARLAALAERPFAELAALPSAGPTEVLGGDVEFTLLRKTLQDGRLEIVVQAYRPGRQGRFLRFGQMLARGIWVSPTGLVEAMPEHSLYDYM